MPPLLILAIAVALVLGMILVLRLNAFLALITAAVVVSLLAPGDDRIARVAEAFGVSAGKLGVPIAMASIIGSCLLASGAADRLIRAALAIFGEKRGATALAASGFTLSIPVFFDTVFFLLVPLARSLFRRTGKHYLKYLLAIGSGGAIAHTLVPPTPGPLLVADQLGVDIGLMMLIGIAVSLPSVGIGLLVAGWLDRVIQLENPPQHEPLAEEAPNEGDATTGPGLFLSSLPILVPVLLVASRTIMDRCAGGAAEGSLLARSSQATEMLGNPNLAMLLAAGLALFLYARFKRPTREERSELVEHSLTSAGMIILVTAAGGAFGAMLKAAEIGPAIESALSGVLGEVSGLVLLLVAFGIASLLKVSQGSSTVAMITASAMLAAMIDGKTLAYNPVYLAIAIGCGSLFGIWMNDSGFWLFCKMGGLTEAEGLKTWTVILAAIALVAMLFNLGLANALPLAAHPGAPT
ncbi:Low-affinity gluconate transporter [Planctomycetes bacterium MalM25]|nr:Low-affinity gluconate transporter [Planctomycetes bacterium MalM25]